MSKNWQFGFQFVQAEWTYFLGDDDIMTISPGILKSILSQEVCDAIVFSKNFFHWGDVTATFPSNLFSAVSDEPVLPARIERPKIPNRINWLIKNLNSYPSGAGSSVVKSSFLNFLDSKDLLFQGISPDWSNAAHYVHLDKEFKRSENCLVSIGFSSVSSIQLYRNPTSVEAQTQIKLSGDQISQALARFPIDCPTTWLSRIDSMYRARVNMNYPILISNFLLDISALVTTPRYVIKMFVYLRRAGSQSVRVYLILLPMFVFSLYNKIIFLLKKIIKGL
jgi:hypothetical protein